MQSAVFFGLTLTAATFKKTHLNVNLAESLQMQTVLNYKNTHTKKEAFNGDRKLVNP